jgi:hypothetical protein
LKRPNANEFALPTLYTGQGCNLTVVDKQKKCEKGISMKALIKPIGAAVLMFWLNLPTQAQTIPFDSNRWEIDAKESRIEEYLGRQSLFLKGGLALVKDAKFLNGVIEFDIAFPEERGFAGTVWRVLDKNNYEEFYFRSHQSGNPDANQYTPNFNGLAGWQLYYGEDFSAPVRYRFNEWMRVKIVVAGAQAEVYLMDMATPALFIPELKQKPASGQVGLSAGNFAVAHFSNFSFAALEAPALKGKAKPPSPTPKGLIMAWAVSSGFPEKNLQGKAQLRESDKAGLTWKKLECEVTGIANLSRLVAIGEQSNTTFARLVINSEREQTKEIKFGFSDRVRVYLNDHLLYAGTDNYASRDYRFLGTIGLWDALYLPLKKGRNELWLAVSEDFGGWGVIAAIEDMNGIQIQQ